MNLFQSDAENLDRDAEILLKPLADIPERQPERVRLGRQKYLNSAKSYAQAVSAGSNLRHTGWKTILFPRKEFRTMSAVTTILLILAMIFGGGATAVAAQTSQPDQALYPVKLFSEDLRLAFAPQPQTRLELLLQFTQTRAEEINALIARGVNIPEAVQTRYQAQIEQAIQLAAGMDPDQALKAMEQVLERLRTQQTQMLQTRQTQNAAPEDPVMLQIRDMLQERIGWLESGSTIPLQERNQQQQRQNQAATLEVSETITPEGSGQGGAAPQDQGGANPWTTTTPVPGSGYGPGPQSTPGHKGGKP